MNAIFVTGNEVLRVSAPTAPASASLELASFLAGAGLRVPTPARDEVVVVGGLSVTSWVRLEPVDAPVDWAEVGEMVRTVHALDPSTLPDSVPLPPASNFPWWDFDALLERTTPLLDDSAYRSLASTIERHRGWATLTSDATSTIGAQVVCHGDVHPGNVVMTADGVTLIDWDLLCWAPPGWDHGPMLTWATVGVEMAMSIRPSLPATAAHSPMIPPRLLSPNSAWSPQHSCGSSPASPTPLRWPKRNDGSATGVAITTRRRGRPSSAQRNLRMMRCFMFV